MLPPRTMKCEKWPVACQFNQYRFMEERTPKACIWTNRKILDGAAAHEEWSVAGRWSERWFQIRPTNSVLGAWWASNLRVTFRSRIQMLTLRLDDDFAQILASVIVSYLPIISATVLDRGKGWFYRGPRTASTILTTTCELARCNIRC